MKAGLRSLSPHTLAAAAFRLRELGIFAALGVTVLFFSVRATNFATVGNWQDIATDVALVAAVAIAGGAVLRWAPWGRDFYAVGSNPEAARLAAIPVARRIVTAFVISGALAGLGGFMFAARFASVDAVAGRGFEFDVVTAVVIGGVNVFGGVGTVLGAVLGAILVATINNGFTLLKISEFWKIFFEGTAIVAAVTVDAVITQRLQELLRRKRRAELLAHEQGVET